MRKPRTSQRKLAAPFTLRFPRDERGCYPPGADAGDSDCFQSDAVIDDGCYPPGPRAGEDLLHALLGRRRPRR